MNTSSRMEESGAALVPKSCCCCRDLVKHHICSRASGGSLTLILTNPPVFITHPASHMIHSVPTLSRTTLFIKELHFHFCTPVSRSENTTPPKKGTQDPSVCHWCCWNFSLTSKTGFQHFFISIKVFITESMDSILLSSTKNA